MRITMLAKLSILIISSDPILTGPVKSDSTNRGFLQRIRQHKEMIWSVTVAPYFDGFIVGRFCDFATDCRRGFFRPLSMYPPVQNIVEAGYTNRQSLCSGDMRDIDVH